MKYLFLGSCLMLSLTSVFACRPHADRGANLLDQPAHHRVAFLSKAKEVLHGGVGFNSAGDPELLRLKTMSDDQAVDYLLNDQRFGDSVLAFNLFYLQRRQDRPVSYDADGSLTIATPVWRNPSAITAAHRAVVGGDYFDLWKFDGLYPLLTGRDSTMSGADREKAYRKIADGLANPERQAQSGGKTTTIYESGNMTSMGGTNTVRATSGKAAAPPICSGSEAVLDNLFDDLTKAGWPLPIVEGIVNEWTSSARETISLWCADPASADFGGKGIREIRESLMKISEGITALMEQFRKIPSATASWQSVGFIRPVAIPGHKAVPRVDGFWDGLSNSSTNHNRKRAATMLKMFFCEDMVPTELIESSVQIPMHAKNKHASDKGCQSCHYKLDPIGGLFRFHGAGGVSRANESYIDFDDSSRKEGEAFADYLDTWRANRSAPFAVGYFVGVNRPHPQWRGDSLADLFQFVTKAPESRQCFARRLAEWYLGPNQIYDPNWLAEISRDFNPGPQSSTQFRAIVKRLILSKSFRVEDPVQGQCYDFPAKANAGDGALPCEINHLIQRECVACHSGFDPKGDGSARLSLNEFVAGPLNPVPWFQHADPSGKQLSRKQSADLILQRLRSADESTRMPPSGDLSIRERNVLIQWFNRLSEVSP